jgi:hypothetical protein
MGVLDDAIREHLALKRLHGASDEEIAKEEAEALGPARRDFPAQQAEASIPVADETGTAVADAPPEPAAEPVDEVAPPTELHEPVAEPAVFEPFTPEAELEPEPEPELERETNDEQEGTEEDDDVLEETPEFLQDAPEHDRLWFEQKPPRDFDFE